MSRSRPHMERGMSMEFNVETGEKQSSQQLWEGSAWERLGYDRSASCNVTLIICK